MNEFVPVSFVFLSEKCKCIFPVVLCSHSSDLHSAEYKH